MAEAKPEDDLIILTDDIQTESPEMIINLDTSESISTTDDMVLTFDESDDPDGKIDAKEEITLESEDDPFQITELEETKVEIPLVNFDSSETSPEETVESEDMLDFSGMTEETSEVKEENTADISIEPMNGSIGTMESILDETISKLEKRQNIIHSEEEKQELAISHLDEEIKQLESEKKEALKIKTDLEIEDEKIISNITQLDKMKASAEVKYKPKK